MRAVARAEGLRMNRRIGRYDRRVTVQSATLVDDGYGTKQPTWSTLLTVWAFVRPVSGREHVIAGGIQAEATVEVGLRGAWPTVLPKMRIVDGSRTFEIVSALLDEDRLDTLCQCREIAA